MKKVALTGNIGSGKSTVAKIFSVLGVPVFNADIEARLLYYEEIVKDKLVELFSEKILTHKGDIDTKRLASIIFNNRKDLQTVNGIIHPMVLEKYGNWCITNSDKIYTIHETAILFENELQKNFDIVINVSAPSDIRLKRVMKRDNVSEELVRERMQNQLSDSIKCELSNFVIKNDGKSFIISQVIDIHNSLISS